MGRVVGFRFALVFGSMTIAMLLGSVLGEVVGPAPVIAVFGLVTVGGRAGRAAGAGRARRVTDGGARRLRYTGARAAPDDRAGRQE